MTPKTQAEANVLANLIYLGAPGPFTLAAKSQYDRCYLFCGEGMERWCEKALVEQTGAGAWMTRRLHKKPQKQNEYRLKRIFRQDVPGRDRFALQVNLWTGPVLAEMIWECDHDGYGALHFPSVSGHIAFGIWHFISRQKTNQEDCRKALIARGVSVALIPAS